MTIERTRALAEKATPTLSKTPKGGSGERKDALWIRLADLEREYERQQKICEQYREELRDELGCIQDAETRTAASLKYVERQSLEEIASLLGYDKRTVYRRLGEARSIYEKHYGV